jgi:hypothetical protein
MIGFSARAWNWLPRALIPNEHGKKVRVLRTDMVVQEAFVARDPETGMHSLVGPPPASMPLPIRYVAGWCPAR